ncbi:unnamed protein product, partial [Polarella glacialis]
MAPPVLARLARSRLLLRASTAALWAGHQLPQTLRLSSWQIRRLAAAAAAAAAVHQGLGHSSWLGCEVLAASHCEGKAVHLIARRSAPPPPDRIRAPNTTVVLVHGLDSWSGTWEPLMSELAQRGFASLAVDLRGHGSSPLGCAQDFSPRQLAVDVHQAIKAAGLLEERGRIVLVGHSMGGRIAMQYAADYPEDLSLLVIEDMDCVPQRYCKPTDRDLERLKAFVRSFDSWQAATQTLISFGYQAKRVEGYSSATDPRIFRLPDGSIGSAINPYAQHLARQSVLNSASGAESLQRVASARASSLCNFPVHLFVAGAESTVCTWDGPGGV